MDAAAGGALFELAIDTGLRRGEIIGLHWSDVDLAARQIVVRYNRVTVDGHVQETTTKTRSGRRTALLSDRGVAALLTWKLRQETDRETAQEAWQTRGTRSPWKTDGRWIRNTSRGCSRRFGPRVCRYLS
ncbi:MAG TPA: tyrosine-type recombinase/integrase [Propionibacteriaceae bacterium]|nr:tyrosine-type recombinase/integrase [Propionibacteriaceae bacterium]